MKRVTLALLILYTLSTTYVVVAVATGLPYTVLFTSLPTLIAMTFALLHAGERMGWKRGVQLFLLTFGVSLLFESVGVATGFVYGPYHYTPKLGMLFLDLVPLLVPAAWFMMVYPSWVIASRLFPPVRPVWAWRLGAAALGGVVMTAWDLVLDPLMVQGEHWVWEVDGGYFGVPLQNYWGWWLTVFVIFLLYAWLARETPSPVVRQPFTYDRQAVYSYTVTGLSTVLLGFINGLPGPALVGLFAMGPWAVMALSSGRQVQVVEGIVPAHVDSIQ